MTVDELNDMPDTAKLMKKEEFVAWIETRTEAASSINIEAAELKGEWRPEGDPYELERETREDTRELKPYFFVRDAESRGWIWQNDLPEDKRAAVQARIDEHDRKANEIEAELRAGARLIDPENCETAKWAVSVADPYDVYLAPYPCFKTGHFVRNKGSNDDWVCVDDLPEEKRLALRGLDRAAERERLARAERERLARKHVIEPPPF